MNNGELRIESTTNMGSRIITHWGGVKKVLYNAGLYLIAGVLLFSGVSKILDPMPLIETLKLVTKLPEELLIIITTIMPIIEIGLGLLIVLKIKPKPVLLATLALFAAFFVFSVYGTIVGLKSDCGCFGGVIKSEIGWWMVVRNILLLGAIIHVINKRDLYEKKV